MTQNKPLVEKETVRQQIRDALLFRHACKAFDPERTIPEEDFELILEAGRLAPSSVGLEPWRFVVVQDKVLREKIRAVSWGAQGQLPTASHFVLILARTMADLKPGSKYIDHLFTQVHRYPPERIERLQARYRSFLDEDFDVLSSPRAMFDWACKQTYIALANMMMTAALLGIDSCPIEGFNRPKLEQLLREEGLLEGDRFGLSCMVAFGYRAQEPRPKTRQPLEAIVRWIHGT
jgi:nitroreductase